MEQDQKLIEEATVAAEAKAKQLTESLKVKIHPFVFAPLNGEDHCIVGFVKEPSRMVKMRMMDKALMAPFSTGAECLDLCLVKEESDPKITSERPEDDAYYMGAVQFCNTLTQQSINQLDKKK